MKMVEWIFGTAMLLSVASVARSEPVPGKHAMKLQIQIQADLQKDPDLKDNSIDVTVDSGVATLKGTVDSKAERAKAERIARASGVAAVDDQLKVGRPSAQAIVDSTVTAKVMGQLVADATLRDADLAVTTDNGVVTLKGNVPSEEAHQHALELARRAAGVKRVQDNLQIMEPMPTPLGTTPK